MPAASPPWPARPTGSPNDDELPPPWPRAYPVTIHLTDDVLRRVKVMATKKRMRYQVLLRQFVLEQLAEEEKQEGSTVTTKEASHAG